MSRLAVAMCLLTLGPAFAAGPPDPVRHAARRGLWRLQEGASNYLTHRQCFACHHQSLTLAAFAAAKKRGFVVPEAFVREQTQFTLDTFRNKHANLRKGLDVGGRNTTVGYALLTLQLVEYPRDDTTDALIDFLLVRQEKDGSWPATTQRQPSEGSKFTNAAHALAALKHYGVPDKTKPERADQINTALRQGTKWLLDNTPKDTEDRVFHLRALAAIGADAKLLDHARRELLAQQLPDGSWKQLADRDGDAYATATVLYALKHSGVPSRDPAYRKGLTYLLRTQTPEGAWIVSTRSKPIQKWFDNGDPGGKDQFISFLATGWATLALLESLPES